MMIKGMEIIFHKAPLTLLNISFTNTMEQLSSKERSWSKKSMKRNKMKYV